MHKQILDLILEYSQNNPEQRFGQILFNLDINQFQNSNDYEPKARDIFYDSDEQILERIKIRIKFIESTNKTNIKKKSNG